MAKRILQGPAPTKMIDRCGQPARMTTKGIIPQPGGK